MKKEKNLVKIPLIMVGLTLIALAIIFPGRNFFTDHERIIKEIDISNFPGEVFSSNEFTLNAIKTIKEKRGIKNFADFPKNSTLVYDNIFNFIKVVIPDETNQGSYKEIYYYLNGEDQYKDYTTKKINQKIFVYDSPNFLIYFKWILFFFILFIVGCGFVMIGSAS